MKKDKEWLRDEINNLYEDYIMSDWNSAVGACEDLVNQLDEPQKPVVPKWFDEWVKSKKESRLKYDCLDLSRCIISEHNEGSLTVEQEEYVVFNPRDILSALLYGYEVEKEKLYYVKMPINDRFNYMMKNKEEDIQYLGKIGFCSEEFKYCQSTHFTEEEIKAIDKRYWAFAVPVDEVENE